MRKIIDNIGTFAIYYLFRILSLFCHYIFSSVGEYREKNGYSNRFEKKFEKVDLLYMAMSLPKTKLSYPSIQKIFPALSKNHIYELIDMKRNIIEKTKKILVNS